MNPQRAQRRDRSGDNGDLTPSSSQHRTIQREDIHIRNYDHQWAYDLDIEIMTANGTVVYRDRFYLQPGHTDTVANALDDGEYELRATLDKDQQKTMTCQIDGRSEHTAVIEVGNGALSLTDGYHA